ncbi:hypothetical protein [Prochlorococcus sp. MIT 1300]|uniref:hypothetical protein n=1 Tax=Prochlorococcus sp. MIT 1300 TaxID=3096218 RepID=UPI002A74C323|nr:hypothetical protein [Prochlorococcus sp. MIT 1300]
MPKKGIIRCFRVIELIAIFYLIAKSHENRNRGPSKEMLKYYWLEPFKPLPEALLKIIGSSKV